MWLVVKREPKPDAPYWPGRRLLAAVDAAVWPLLWVLVFSHAPKPVGLIGLFVAAVALLCALGRLHRALWVNHRYWFTTWRWGRIAAALLLMGLVLKLVMPA
jgi:hypothetical protein